MELGLWITGAVLLTIVCGLLFLEAVRRKNETELAQELCAAALTDGGESRKRVAKLESAIRSVYQAQFVLHVNEATLVGAYNKMWALVGEDPVGRPR